MSRRTSIVKALSEKFKVIDGTGSFSSNIYNNSYSKLKFWDEVSDFPCIYSVGGGETRQYLPSGFKWGFFNISIKLYVKGEEPDVLLENLIDDVEKVLDSTDDRLVYDADNDLSTSQLTITSITTDEGLLVPYGVGEINLLVRYQVL